MPSQGNLSTTSEKDIKRPPPETRLKELLHEVAVNFTSLVDDKNAGGLGAFRTGDFLRNNVSSAKPAFKQNSKPGRSEKKPPSTMVGSGASTKNKSFDAARSFLSSLGVLQYSNSDDFCLLDSNGELLWNHLNVLDQSSPRETVKVGVAYVGPGQRTELEILRNNECSSPEYNAFLGCLGERVLLKDHLGFMGKLKPGTDGLDSIYYSNTFVEIMFHVVTMMPNRENDTQFINKKKFVGNDHVTIVWLEHPYPFRRNTINSQFNCFVIVIQPLPNKLYRLQIMKKDNVEICFPWLDKITVGFERMVKLVRYIAIQGNRGNICFLTNFCLFEKQCRARRFKRSKRGMTI